MELCPLIIRPSVMGEQVLIDHDRATNPHQNCFGDDLPVNTTLVLLT